MFRPMLASLAVILLAAFSAAAQPVIIQPAGPLPTQPVQVVGRIKHVDVAKHHLVLILPDNKEMFLELAPDTRVIGTFAQGRLLRRTVTMEIAGGPASLQPNTPVVVTTMPFEGRTRATEIRVEGVQRRVVAR